MADENLSIPGGCLCGAIRYEATTAPYYAGYCHSRCAKRAWVTCSAHSFALELQTFATGQRNQTGMCEATGLKEVSAEFADHPSPIKNPIPTGWQSGLVRLMIEKLTSRKRIPMSITRFPG
jgi:hypothetical protein